MVAALLVLLSRLIVVRYFPHLFPESIEIFVGMVLLLGIAIFRDLRDRRTSPTGEEASAPSMFEERTQRIINNLPLIAVTGALISAVASMKIFGGSEVSIYTLAKAYAPGISPEESDALLHQAALAEFMRGLGFIPLIATTALATGVYAVAGFTFVFVVGYLSPRLACRTGGRHRHHAGNPAAALYRQMAGPISFGAQCIRQYPQRDEYADGIRLVDRLHFRGHQNGRVRASAWRRRSISLTKRSAARC